MNSHPSIEPLEARIAPATIFAINDSNGLFSFDSETPGTISSITAITGLGAGEVVKTIDFRPATGGLYGIAISGAGTFSGRLYLIDTASGAAGPIGVAFSTTLATAAGYGMDFDAVEDRIRVVNQNEQNLRVNPNDGTLAGTDTTVTGATSVAALAYTNNYAGAASTTLYGVNFVTDDLEFIGGLNATPSPDGGVATKVGDISVATDANTQDRLGLDILTTLEGNTAFYSGSFSSQQRLYTLNLTTAAATLVGAIGTGMTPVFDIAVQPAAFTFTAGKSFTYTDGDGDLVTVKTSAGTLNSAQFSWLTSADGTRRELTQFNIVGDTTFTGANLTFIAKKTATGGDGRVDVASIVASGVNLGAVTIGGNLEAIEVGTNDPLIPAMKSFSVLSMSRAFGGGDAASVGSDIDGAVPVFKIKGDLNGVGVLVEKAGTVTIGGSIIGGGGLLTGGFTTSNGVQSFTLGGSIIAGTGENTGYLGINGPSGAVKIGGSVVGGPNFSGTVVADALGSLTIGGSVIAGPGHDSGRLDLTLSGALKISGSVFGGPSQDSGKIVALAKAITIGGSVIGGGGQESGHLTVSAGSLAIGGSIAGGAGQESGTVLLALGVAKSAKVGGSIFGGGGQDSGKFGAFAEQTTIAGSIVGGPSMGSGTATVFGKTFRLGGSVQGGEGNNSGTLTVSSTVAANIVGSIFGGIGTTSGVVDALGSSIVTLGGNITAGSATGSGALTFENAKTVTIKGGLIGSQNAAASILIRGKINPATAAEAIAIGSLSIGGSVTHGQILIGGSAMNVNATAGKITIGGDFIASSIAAGFRAGTDTLFGTNDDAPAAMGTLPDIKAAIGSIIIKGRAAGTGSDGDHYGIVAEQLGSVMIAGRTIALNPAAQDNVLVGPFGDFRVREFAVP